VADIRSVRWKNITRKRQIHARGPKNRTISLDSATPRLLGSLNLMILYDFWMQVHKQQFLRMHSTTTTTGSMSDSLQVAMHRNCHFLVFKFNTNYCVCYLPLLTLQFIEPGRSGRTQISKSSIFHHRKRVLWTIFLLRLAWYVSVKVLQLAGDAVMWFS